MLDPLVGELAADLAGAVAVLAEPGFLRDVLSDCLPDCLEDASAFLAEPEFFLAAVFFDAALCLSAPAESLALASLTEAVNLAADLMAPGALVAAGFLDRAMGVAFADFWRVLDFLALAAGARAFAVRVALDVDDCSDVARLGDLGILFATVVGLRYAASSAKAFCGAVFDRFRHLRQLMHGGGVPVTVLWTLRPSVMDIAFAAKQASHAEQLRWWSRRNLAATTHDCPSHQRLTGRAALLVFTTLAHGFLAIVWEV